MSRKIPLAKDGDRSEATILECVYADTVCASDCHARTWMRERVEILGTAGARRDQSRGGGASGKTQSPVRCMPLHHAAGHPAPAPLLDMRSSFRNFPRAFLYFSGNLEARGSFLVLPALRARQAGTQWLSGRYLPPPCLSL